MDQQLTIDASREALAALERIRIRCKHHLPIGGVFFALAHYDSHEDAFPGRLSGFARCYTQVSTFLIYIEIAAYLKLISLYSRARGSRRSC